MTKLHYHRSGDGPPLVLIHGGFLDHRMWSDTHVALSANYDVISYDVRGAGESVRPRERRRQRPVSGAVVAAIEHAVDGLGECHVHTVCAE